MFQIRRSHDRLIFNMGILIPGKDGLYIETCPRLHMLPYNTVHITSGQFAIPGRCTYIPCIVTQASTESRDII